jgi:hypothetical protein
MDDYSLHARMVSPESVVDAVIGVASSPRPLSAGDISDVIDKGDRYTSAVVHLCKELGLVKQVGSDYIANSEIEEEARKLSPAQGFILINEHLLRYEPFMTFVSFLDKGYDSDRSAQSVETLYDMKTDPEIVKKQFLDLGQYADILTDEEQPKPTVEVESLPTAYIEDLRDALHSEAETRLFVQERLGEEVVAYADAESIEKIQDALITFRNSPDTAIVESVVGAENITRELATDEGDSSTNYSSAGGIGQVAQMMSGDDLILKRHLHGANYLGSMRIPGSHGKAKETLESWEVDEDVALEVILATMDYIRSLYWFVKYERQIL